MSWFNDLLGFGGGGDQVDSTVTSTPRPVQLPDYPEANAARENWSGTLQDWQKQPGYGAIQPNWNDIWTSAREKVQRYFQGGPEGPGLNAQVKAGAARRGVADSASGDALLQRSGFQQGNALQDIATKMAMEEANLSESGRKTWLSSLQQLAGLKPSFAIGNEVVKTNPGTNWMQGIGDILTSAGENVIGSGGMGGGGGDMDWLTKILGMSGAGGTGDGTQGDTGIGNVASMFGGNGGGTPGGMGNMGGGSSDKEFYKDPQFYAQMAQLLAMFAA